jgi:hypothetical protein
MMDHLRRRSRPPSLQYAPWESAMSIEALRRAWLAVRANRGGAGADGVTIAQFEAKLEDS